MLRSIAPAAVADGRLGRHTLITVHRRSRDQEIRRNLLKTLSMRPYKRKGRA